MNQRLSNNFRLLACAAVLSGCAGMHSSDHTALSAPTVPASLAVQPAQVLSLIAEAKGVQLYSCGPNKTDANKYEWQFKAPDATLFDSHGNTIGKHYAGPTWESNDGSKVGGQVQASEKSADPNAIAWLLLSVKANSDASSTANGGVGVLTKTTAIQRLNTVGGKPPSDGCDQTQTGKEIRVPYTAKYYFYN